MIVTFSALRSCRNYWSRAHVSAVCTLPSQGNWGSAVYTLHHLCTDLLPTAREAASTTLSIVPAHAVSEPGDSLAAFEDALASLKLVDEQRGNVLISATHAEAMDPEGKVTLLPADMSQGREWPVVLVTGLEQRAGKQPSSAAHQERQAKLLLYVGAARLILLV